MAILQLADAGGNFTINGNSSYPKGQFYVDVSGPRVSLINTKNLGLRIVGRFEEWRGVEGETFATPEAARDYLNGFIATSIDDESVLRIIT